MLLPIPQARIQLAGRICQDLLLLLNLGPRDKNDLRPLLGHS